MLTVQIITSTYAKMIHIEDVATDETILYQECAYCSRELVRAPKLFCGVNCRVLHHYHKIPLTAAVKSATTITVRNIGTSGNVAYTQLNSSTYGQTGFGVPATSINTEVDNYLGISVQADSMWGGQNTHIEMAIVRQIQ